MMMKQRQLWKEGHLCDVVLKSRDGTEHHAHSLVLSAASAVLKKLLVGPFREADQVRQGKPVEIAASEAAVSALLDYVYGGQPEVKMEDSLELLQHAEVYDLPELAAAMEAGLRSSLTKAPVASVLKLLQQTETHGLFDLQAASEEKVAANFESCIQHAEFLKLSPSQLSELLQREDLVVSREDVVLQGVFTWFNSNKDKGHLLGVLLRDVDFPSISLGNLSQLRCFAASLGPDGNHLQRKVVEAVRAHKKRSATESQADAFRPKRRCLSHWSSDLGASSEDSGKKVLSIALLGMCWNKGAIYGRSLCQKQILCWKPGDAEPRAVAGEGAHVAGVNDLGLEADLRVSVLPDGEILVADRDNKRLVSIQNGFGRVLLSDVEGLEDVFCSPNGVVYVLNKDGQEVQKLVGSTLQPFIDSKNLPEELQFDAGKIFVTKEEVLYLCDHDKDRILRFSPGDSKPLIVKTLAAEMSEGFFDLFVTEGGKIYVNVREQGVVLALHPGDTTFTEVLRCPGNLMPGSVLVQGRSMYVSMWEPGEDTSRDGVYEYVLPPELQLERF